MTDNVFDLHPKPADVARKLIADFEEEGAHEFIIVAIRSAEHGAEETSVRHTEMNCADLWYHMQGAYEYIKGSLFV